MLGHPFKEVGHTCISCCMSVLDDVEVDLVGYEVL